MDPTRKIRSAAVDSAKTVLGAAARNVLNPGGNNYQNERVENVNHFISEFLQTANHVYIPRPAYDHHFLIKSAKYYDSKVLKVKLIHYRQILMDPQDPENGEEGVQKTGNQDGKFSGVVAEDILDVNLSDPNKPKVLYDTAGYFDDLRYGNWHVVIDPDYPETEEKRDEAVDRAEARLGEKKYKIFSNNCETFVTEVLKPGQGCSQQAVRAAKAIVKSSAAASMAFSPFSL